MKKRSSLLLVVAVLSLGFLPAFVLGATMKAGESPTISSTESISDDLYIAGQSVTINGSIFGDVVTAGNTVIVNSAVVADVAAVGGTVTVSGVTGDDLRAAGGDVYVQGSVEGDVVILGGKIILSSPRIGGDANLLGGEVTVQSPIQGDVNIRGGEVYIDSEIQGKVWVNASKLKLGPHANIHGALSYKSPVELTKETGAVVAGPIDFKKSESKENANATFRAIVSVIAIIKLFSLLIGSLLVASLFRRYAEKVIHNAHVAPERQLLRGVVTMIVLPIASILLLITVVGIPFGILGLIAFVGLMIFGWLLSPIVLSGYLSGKNEHGQWKKPNNLHIAMSVLVFWLIGIVPFIGGVVQTIIIFIAIGAAVEIKNQIMKEWR